MMDAGKTPWGWVNRRNTWLQVQQPAPIETLGFIPVSPRREQLFVEPFNGRKLLPLLFERKRAHLIYQNGNKTK